MKLFILSFISLFIHVYKVDILEKCERKYLEAIKQYQDGNISNSRMMFDSFLEHLEYLQDEKQSSDSLMISEFNNEFSDINSEVDIFELKYEFSFNSIGNLFFKENSSILNQQFLKLIVSNLEYDDDINEEEINELDKIMVSVHNQ